MTRKGIMLDLVVFAWMIRERIYLFQYDEKPWTIIGRIDAICDIFLSYIQSMYTPLMTMQQFDCYAWVEDIAIKFNRKKRRAARLYGYFRSQNGSD